MNPPIVTIATLVDKKQLTTNIAQFTFTLAHPIKFVPGQYLSLRCAGMKRYRAFSFSSSPSEKIEIIVKKNAEFTTLLFASKLGTQFEAMAPMGRFLHDIKDSVFVAAGVGITPFLSYIRSMRDERIIDREVWLFYSCQKQENIIAEQELRNIQQTHSNINIILTLTQEKPKNWDMELGRINHAMLEKYLGSLDRNFYTCGPDEMIKSLHARLIEAGVPKERLFEEDWG